MKPQASWIRSVVQGPSTAKHFSHHHLPVRPSRCTPGVRMLWILFVTFMLLLFFSFLNLVSVKFTHVSNFLLLSFVSSSNSVLFFLVRSFISLPFIIVLFLSLVYWHCSLALFLPLPSQFSLQSLLLDHLLLYIPLSLSVLIRKLFLNHDTKIFGLLDCRYIGMILTH